MDQERPRPPPHHVPTTAREWEYGGVLPAGYGLPSRRQLELEWLPAFVIDALTPPSTGDRFDDLAERWKETTVRDVHGLRLRVERAGTTARRTWHYDNNGYWTRFTDFDGATWHRSFGSWNHLREMIDPLGSRTSFEHTKREQLARVTDAGGTVHGYAYDLRNRLSEVRRHGGVRESYTYDAAGELAEKVDANGNVLVRYERKDEGRHVVRTLANGERHELRYTAARQLQSASAEAPDGKRDEYAFAYNLVGARVCDERNGVGVRCRFLGAKLAEMRVLEQFVTRYTWTSENTLGIVDPTGAKHTIQRCHGGVIRRTTSNRVTEISHYHPDGYCLSKMAMVAGGLWKRTYERSEEGDVLAIRDSLRGRRSFTYDAAHRLVGELLPDGASRAFKHTRGGDLFEAPGLRGVTLDEHRLHDANGNRFEYDHRHHVAAVYTPNGTVHLRRDARDQLVVLHGPGVGVWSARYDVLGRRIETTHNGATTSFYWDSDRLVAEILPDKRLRVYIYADELAFAPFMFVDYASGDAELESGKRYVILANHLGAPELIQDDAGAVVWRAWYEAYGLAHVEVGADFHQPVRWPGHYFDAATRLHYNRFRYYSPELGRYVESDPDGIRGGLNLHAYADGNPLRYVDLRGLGCGDGNRDPNNDEDRPEQESSARPKVADEVFHLVTSPGAGQGVLCGIDKRFFNPESRFGKAFYVAEEPGTAFAEVAHHEMSTTHGIRFSVDHRATRILDLTDPHVAKEWGYHGGEISSETRALGPRAKEAGYNTIRYPSERASGGTNLAILDDYNQILTPRMISPAT
ncbi:RHS repeat-associated core domain-containing protein [Pendulispora albinea]|uniref:RES domain-containing protein n=1 Tax=Pendulispora albinea TaxID=2741071 RepID=A0ABZ2MAB8_9BACT